MHASRFLVALLAGPAMTLLPLVAHANTICCEAGGQTWCNYGMPPACVGKAYRVIDDHGTIIRQVAAPLTPEQQAKRDAELAKQKAAEEKQAEQDRQDRKLLGTYDSLDDLDAARDRSLSDMKKGQQEMEKMLSMLQKQQQKLANDAAFYNAKHPMPALLKSQIDSNNQDIQAQQNAITERMQEMADTQKKFMAERRRYIQLMTQGTR